MNNDGFGLQNFIVLISIMLVCFAIILGIYNDSFKPLFSKYETNVSSYSKMLNKLSLAAQRYQNDNYYTNSYEKVTWILTYSLLKKENYIDEILDKDNKECEGYVVFKQNNTKISYKPYLKCDNYKTKGYNEDNV